MAFEPANRYQSARELALDLEHWIADEPVAAYPEQRLQRLSRWLRRHRSWTYAGGGGPDGDHRSSRRPPCSWSIGHVSPRGKPAIEAESNFKMAQQGRR